MRTYDISRPPELIDIGFDGENKWRPRGFNCAGWLKKHPDGIITLWVQPKGVRKAFPVSTTKIENTIVWYPLSEELYPGTGELQLTIQDGEYVGKSDTIKFEVNKSLVSGGAHPDSQPSWATQIIQDVTEQADRAEEAASRIDPESIEQTVAEAVEGYMDEHPVQAPVQSVNGKTGAVTLSASDVGALPDSTVIPTVPQMATDPDMTDWTTGKTVDAAVLATDFDVVGRVLSAKYTKPSSGIPASDLAADVQTSLGKADTALQQHQSLSGYATETWVQNQGYGTYSKPSGGIPASDLASGVIPDVSGKLNTNQGAANAGKFLVVGSDGEITPVTMTAWTGGSY